MLKFRSVGVGVVVLGIGALQWLSAQTQTQISQSPSEAPILEVVQHAWNIGRDETLVFLRVYADGHAEAHPTRKVDFRNITYKRKILSSEQLESLRVLLASPETAKLEDSSRTWGGHDFGYEWTIKMAQQHRTMHWTNFQPFLARERKAPYPSQLERLGCVIWRLRVEVSGEGLDKDYVRGCKEIGM